MSIRKLFAAAVAAIAAAVFLTLPSSAATLSPGTYLLNNPASIKSNEEFIGWEFQQLPETGSLVGRIKDGTKTYNMYLQRAGGYYQARLARVTGYYSIQNKSTNGGSVTLYDADIGSQWEIIIYCPPTRVSNKILNNVVVPTSYPGVQISIVDHRITWTTPQHSGTLLNYEVLRYDDDSIIANLPADTTSYQPLYSDRLYIKTYYETPEGDGVEVNSNDVDYIAYYPGVEITQDGYRISWEAPIGFPSLAEIKGYIIYIDGVQAGVTQQTNTLIVQGGTYEVQVQYQGSTRSTLSNAITYTPTEEDQLPMINNQLTLIREMIQQRDMADPEVVQALQDLVQATQGLAQEDTLQSVLERMTDLYNAILEHYGGASEDASEIITQLSDVATQLRDLPRTDQLPDIEIPEVGVEDFTSAISGLTVLAGALAPLVSICFCYPKIAIYMTISIIVAIVLAILRHGVD